MQAQAPPTPHSRNIQKAPINWLNCGCLRIEKNRLIKNFLIESPAVKNEVIVSVNPTRCESYCTVRWGGFVPPNKTKKKFLKPQTPRSQALYPINYYVIDRNQPMWNQ